jgi:hypothetical protein
MTCHSCGSANERGRFCNRCASKRPPTAPTRLRVPKAVGAAAAGLLVTAALGYGTAAAVGLTSPAAGPVVEALPTMARQAEPPGPTFGQTLDLDGAHADRGTRSSAADSSTARPSSAPPSTSTPPSTPAPPPPPSSRPAPAPSSEPTRHAVSPVRQGDACRTQGAAGVSKSGSVVVCTVAPGHGGLRWRHA